MCLTRRWSILQASNSESETEGGDKEVDLSTLRNLLLRTTDGGQQLQEKPNTKNVSTERQKGPIREVGCVGVWDGYWVGGSGFNPVRRMV